ncbi:right-handed parallel beta-helix repeat-containing protein [Tundrisphaera lichenicola]|uniref:right-handed parallel beta-helix repeat-containing protein n=1 Tax=Tundrisphaera lichenicola TaxID=2029860 RepID=UPI003EBDAC6D
MERVGLTRRGFLIAAAASAGAASRFAPAGDDPRPPVTDPRATDGDERFEPNWDERLTITVGPEGRDADLAGHDDKVIQAALGHVASLGGGTVRLLSGTYTLRHPVVLPSRVRLVGDGADTIITKIPSRTVALADDSDWYDREITLEDARGFQVGDGVVFRATNPHDGGALVIKRTLVARSGNRFKLDSGLRENLWLSGKPTCSAMFPLLTSERTADVLVENLTLDGDRANNERLDGNYAGCVFLQDCNRYTFRGVTARNYHGDGISFQVSHDVVVEDCHCHDNADLGVHPGSGSQRPLIRGNRLERNSIGLFWCWGVKYGLAEKNRIVGNRDYGISIGHHDTDNLIRDNDVQGSGKVGILFRDESRGKDFWPNRNRVEANRVTDSGGDDGVAIDVRGKTRELRIADNLIRETRGPSRRTGLRIAAEARAIAVTGNRFEGLAEEVVDLRESSGS